jgi:RNA polymerase sigma factor (sigma-70 family)
MDRQYFYQIPTPLDRHPYLQWQIDPRLRRYIYQRIPDDLARSQVLEIAQILVVELCQLPTLDLPNYTPAQRCLRGCITALLAQTLFLDRRVGAKVHLQIRRQIFEPLQLHFQETELQDIYQTGLSIICHPAQFLKNFQPDRLDWYQSLATYSYYKFRQSLIDRLRTLPNAADFKRTNLGLLYRSSIEAALKECEPEGARFEGLLLLHQCFREAVVAKEFVTNQPQPSHYDALLVRYRSHPESNKLEIVDRAMAIELLQDLGNTLRNYRQLGTYSLDTTVGDADSGTTFGDLQASPQMGLTIEDTEIRERAIQFLDRQPPNCVLMLIYGLELKQTEAGSELDLNQATIGRQAKRSIAKLAQAFYLDRTPIESERDAWVAPMAGEPSRGDSALSVEVLAKYIDYLTWICEDYYPTLLTTMLTEILADSQIAASTVDIFVDRVETQWQFKFKPGGIGSTKIDTFVQQHQQRGKWARNEDIHPSLQLKPEHTQL